MRIISIKDFGRKCDEKNKKTFGFKIFLLSLHSLNPQLFTQVVGY